MLRLPNIWILLSSLLYMAGMLLAALLRRDGWRLGLVCTLMASLVAAAGATAVFLLPAYTPQTVIFWQSAMLVSGMPALQLEIRVDQLSAFFVLLISLFAAMVAVYSSEALKAGHYQRRRRGIVIALNLFVWATVMVVVLNDMLSVITALELMTLAFAYLTLYKHYHYAENPTIPIDPEAIRSAGLAPAVYLIISHTSTVCLLVTFGLLAQHAHSMSFDAFRAMAHKATLSPLIATIIFMLALLGTSIRAGLIPFHFWVPLVHPASPTPTHAFSLGIAIKVALYLMLRIFFQFLEPQPLWGYMLFLIGVSTALVGVWYAIMSHDLKTALAYHSVENIGIMTCSIGLALYHISQTALSTENQLADWIVSIALIAALYHLLNHAVFKGLLYLCTGAIDNLTNQIVEIERLGGLMKLYPWTSLAFLIGSLSIAGFPPFNGFVSEWLTLQVLLHSIRNQVNQPALLSGAMLFIVGLILLVAAFALTAFCFLKISGLALLGPPRTGDQLREQWSKQDVAFRMRSMIGLMAVLCLVLGIFPAPVVLWLSTIVQTLLSHHSNISPSTPWSAQWPDLTLVQQPEVLALPILALVCLFFGIWIMLRLLRALIDPPENIHVQRAWLMGAKPGAQNPPTAASLSALLRWSLGARPYKQKDKSYAEPLPDSFVMTESMTYPQRVPEIFRAAINRLAHRVLTLAEWLGGTIQNGDLRRYLLYIFLAVACVLIIFLVR